MKRWYKFLKAHACGILWCLYLLPIIALFFPNTGAYLFAVLFDCAILVTIQAGSSWKWGGDE